MSNKPMRAGVLQMVSTDDLSSNLAQAADLMHDAARRNCDLVVLPENFAVFGVSSLSKYAESEQQPGPIMDFLAKHAKDLGLWVVGGTMPFSVGAGGQPAETQRVYAGSGVWSPQGDLVARYDKIHLFDVSVDDGVGRYQESSQFAPGLAPSLCDTPWATLGLSVCYDLRFPELYRLMSSRGAEVLTVPAAFTFATGRAHWEVLLRARAIENQCFVLASNQGGDHGSGRITWGHSCIVDPWGEVLARRDEPGCGVVVAELDLLKLRQIRERMPTLEHRRL